jgi:hypothetical protein
MKCNSHASFLAHTFASPYLGREPKAKVATKLLGKGYGTNCDVILKNVLDAHFGVHFASLHCLNKIFIPNFVHHYFWPKSLQELGYFL